jgi:hypothetical protein
MSDRRISVRIPDGFDALLRAHAGATAPGITDAMRREYLVAILAAVVTSLDAPLLADALVRLNGATTLVAPPRGATIH